MYHLPPVARKERLGQLAIESSLPISFASSGIICIMSFHLQKNTHGDINLLLIPAKDYLSYGRALLDLLFSKPEQKEGLFHIKVGSKCLRPLLDRQRVQLIYGKQFVAYCI